MGILDIFKPLNRRSGEGVTPGQAGGGASVQLPAALLRGSTKMTYNDLSSPTLAMKISTVYRCIDILAKSVASIPLEAKIKVGSGAGSYFVYDENNPANYLLSVRPNSRQTAFEFMQSIVVQMVTRGNAYIYPVRSSGVVRSFILLTPGSVSYDALQNIYVIADAYNKINGIYGADDIIHVKNLSLDGGMTGVSTISYAAKVLAISANADEEQNDIFSKGGVLHGFITGDGSLGIGVAGEAQLKTISDRIESQIASGKNILPLSNEMKFQQISLSSKDIELLDSKQFNVYEICRFFGVHPDKVFAQATSNYKASEMSQVAFLTDTLQPILMSVQNAFTAKLISPATFGRVSYEFNSEAILKTDLTTHADYISKTIATGTRTVNYWRRKHGEAPVQWGDEVLVSANLVPLDSEKLWGKEDTTEEKV